MIIEVYEDSVEKLHAIDPENPNRLVDFAWNETHTSYDPNNTQIAVRLAMDQGATINENSYPNSFYPAPHVPTLDEAKTNKRNAIDARTQELIFAGCPYNEKLFSLQTNDQNTWNAIAIGLSIQIIEPPISCVTMTGERVILETKEEFLAMYQYGLGYVAAILEGGRVIKDAVNLCQTVEEVQNVSDPR